jgi:hypothetical protein
VQAGRSVPHPYLRGKTMACRVEAGLLQTDTALNAAPRGRFCFNVVTDSLATLGRENRDGNEGYDAPSVDEGGRADFEEACVRV